MAVRPPTWHPQSPRAMQSHSTLPSRSWVWPGVLLEGGLLLNFRSCFFYVVGKVRGVIVIAAVRTAFPGRSRVFSWSPRVLGCIRKSVYSEGWCNPNTWDCDFVGTVRESRREWSITKTRPLLWFRLLGFMSAKAVSFPLLPPTHTTVLFLVTHSPFSHASLYAPTRPTIHPSFPCIHSFFQSNLYTTYYMQDTMHSCVCVTPNKALCQNSASFRSLL